MSRAIVFAGGGTGGHLFPGLAIAEEIRALDPRADCLFLCGPRPSDASLLGSNGAAWTAIPARPFGLRPRTLARFVAGWGAAVRAARARLTEVHATHERIDLVAMGGYVSAPAAQAARSWRIPVTLVNLDVVPGKANTWIARRARRIVTAVEVPGVRWTHVGPIIRRSAIASGTKQDSRRSLGLDPGTPTLLVVGGSLGASSINGFMTEFARVRPEAVRGWQILHQAGAGEADGVRARYAEVGVRAVVVPFIDRMGDAWGAADLAISRAGAGSVSEVLANRVPTLFMPYPHHRDQHQRLNALSLAESGGAVLVADRIDPSANLAEAGRELVRLLEGEPERSAMSAALARLGPTDGAALVADMILRDTMR